MLGGRGCFTDTVSLWAHLHRDHQLRRRREEVSAQQLRDDLLSMLVAGHETTGSALTWTMYLLAYNPDKMAKVCSAPFCLRIQA